MTIVSDMNAALDAEHDKVLHGKRIKPNRRWRMGPAARAALVACADPADPLFLIVDGEPRYFGGIIIEPVDPAEHPFGAASEDRFNGWELRA